MSPTDSEEEDPVYKCLAVSYNLLKNEGLKSLFLLCGCLNYGDISMHHLLIHAVGLDLFDRLQSLATARNKLVKLVSDLKASSLLLDGEGDGGETSRLLFMDADDNKTVRMHDVVRDVARKIAFKDPHHRFKVIEDVPSDQDWLETDQNSKFISLNCEAVHELPHRLVCPKLQFFLLRNASPSLNIPNTFFEGMNLLKVLDLSGMDFETLPSTLQSLASLRTLCLDRCQKLRDIAEIGELKKLQVLSMAGSSIRLLPQEMAKLTNLRLLNLNYCKMLEVIPRNTLSKLSRLECLFMKSSFSEWAVKELSDGESNIACLWELNDLNHLTTVQVEIPVMEMIPEEDKFFHFLTSFAIFIGNFNWWEKRCKRSKTLRVKGGDQSLLLRNGMCKLLEKTEELQLSELKGRMEDKGKGTVSIPYDDGVLLGGKVEFPSLEKLHISNLDNVEKIWQNEFIADSFGKLKRLSVQSCQKLKNIIPTIMLKRLPSLLSLKIVNCDSVEEVFNLEDINNEESHDIPVLQLRELCLDNLKNLQYVWNKAPEGLLTYQNLNRVEVSHCPSLTIPFPGYVVRSLLQVKEVDLKSCGVEEIVAHEDVAKVVSLFLFPEENSLTNSFVHELNCFYLGLHTLKWPKLKTLEVESHESLEKLACKLDKDVEQPIFLCDKNV